MNTTELIEIAKECGAYSVAKGSPFEAHVFSPPQLQQFAQRIEAPHKQRIAELEQQIEQLREALRKVSTNSLTCGCSAIADKALEQTK